MNTKKKLLSDLPITSFTHILLLLCTLSFVLIQSCNTTEPGNSNSLILSVKDVSSTEAWLKLETENLSLPASVFLLKNNTVAQTISLGTSDTVIYVDSLLPNKTYTFQTSGNGNTVSPIQSNKVSTTTLDTTSHNFTWQTFTFGEQGAGSSYLTDVAIVNDTSIWAVGAIYLKDSTGQPDPEQYAVAHWNGNSWQLMKLRFNCRLYYPNCGPETRLIVSGNSIFARNKNDIWIAAGSVHHFDGTKWSEEAGILGAGSANKIWGNENGLWFVGSNGFIAHRSSNGEWSKIESGTELPINDVWGSKNKIANEGEIIAAASDKFLDMGKKLLAIKGAEVSVLDDSGLTWSLSSIWFSDKYKVYIVGDGIYVKNYPVESWQNITGSITTFYTHSISGNNLNDIVLCGSGGELVHFNGSTWQSYRNNGLPVFYGNYLSVTIKGNIICAVGEASLNSNKAIIALGFR